MSESNRAKALRVADVFAQQFRMEAYAELKGHGDPARTDEAMAQLLSALASLDPLSSYEGGGIGKCSGKKSAIGSSSLRLDLRFSGF